jgi:hypothetical protein
VGSLVAISLPSSYVAGFLYKVAESSMKEVVQPTMFLKEFKLKILGW